MSDHLNGEGDALAEPNAVARHDERRPPPAGDDELNSIGRPMAP
jgi:hypothetical protein